MSVPEGMRSKSRFEVIEQALGLAEYTINIMKNDKKFPPKLLQLMGKNYAESAIKIFNLCFEANLIRVTSKGSWGERKKLQEKADRACTVLLADISLGAEVYKLPTKRVESWSNMVVETLELIRAWRDADQKRYGKIE